MRLLLLGVLGMGCAKVTPLPSPASHKAIVRTGASDGITHEGLAAVLEADWQQQMQSNPSWARELGESGFDRSIDPVSLEQKAQSRQQTAALLSTASGLTGLNDFDRRVQQIFLLKRKTELAEAVCKSNTWSLSARHNLLTQWSSEVESARLNNLNDAEDLLYRLKKIVEQPPTVLSNLRKGLEAGRVVNEESARRIIQMMTDELQGEDSALAEVTRPDSGFTDEEWRAFEAALQTFIQNEAHPQLQQFVDAFSEEFLPKARSGDNVGLSGITDGDQCYAAKIEAFTSLPLTAEDLHQTGLDELKSIHEEFRELGERVFGTQDLKEIFLHLRTDPGLRFETKEQIITTAEEALSRATAAVPSAFGIQPKAECVVEPIPDYLAPYTTIAYYKQPKPGSPGAYAVNTYEPHTRPRFEAEVLAFHESIPGHHLQIAIAQERKSTPAFMKNGGFTVFVEGWALYTERLSDELGLYSNDLSRLGMLSFDAWRATRLVVDTGIHHYGWSREKAEAFFLQNTPLAENNISNEVDRYITWPGQALAYKTGQLEIFKLRAHAKRELGEKFNLKGFHDAVLKNGAVPLEVLKTQVQEWINSQTSEPAP